MYCVELWMWLCTDWYYSFDKWACIWICGKLEGDTRGCDGKKGCGVEYKQYILIRFMTSYEVNVWSACNSNYLLCDVTCNCIYVMSC